MKHVANMAMNHLYTRKHYHQYKVTLSLTLYVHVTCKMTNQLTCVGRRWSSVCLLVHIVLSGVHKQITFK